MPVPDSLRLELRHYMIGQKLRALRLRRSMGLTQLGQRAGLSPALLSKIENGKLVPTLPTLLRVAMVFDVPLEHFFRDEHKHRIVSVTRKEERDRTRELDAPAENGCRLTRLDLGRGERKFYVYFAEFPLTPESGATPHVHQGFEFVHVLTGSIHVSLGGDDNLLHAGDSIYFDSALSHAYLNVCEEKCTALMVVTRPECNFAERRMDRLEASHHAFRRSLRNTLQRSPSTGQPEIVQKDAPAQPRSSLSGPA